MKALIATDDDRVLGFAMLGAEAGEVVAAVADCDDRRTA
jgi:pyruvate/2-oxoglutarate dehydrogenase complex dihydrolipoamide dehydrogenase (E3) component